MRNHIDTLMEKLAKSNIGVDDQREIGSGLTLLLVSEHLCGSDIIVMSPISI